jgi:hypothetical protein
MKKLHLVALIIILSISGYSQNTFVKTFPQGEYDTFKDILVTSDQQYQCITDNLFLNINNKGETTFEKQLKDGTYSSLSSIEKDDNNFTWIASHVIDVGSVQRKVVYKFDPQGQLVKKGNFIPATPQSFENLKLIKSSGNHFFLINKHHVDSEVHLDIAYLDEEMNEVWSHELSDIIYHNFSARSTSNGHVLVLFREKSDFKNKLIEIDKLGNIVSKKSLNFQTANNTQEYIADFIKTNDGGFLFTGSLVKDIISFESDEDALLIKTDKDGNELWNKTFDVYKSDGFVSMQEVNDGFVMLGHSGMTSSTFDEADILLMKTDIQGNQKWIKGYGTSKMDYGKKLLVLANEELLFGGQASYTFSTSDRVIIKTDKNGSLGNTLPFPLSPASDIKKLQGSSINRIERIGKAIINSDANVIIGSNILQTNEGNTYPYISNYTLQGNMLWQKQLSNSNGTVKNVKPTKDGNYIAITELTSEFFGTEFNVIKIQPNGDSIWRKSIGISGSLKDVIATEDGGYLVTGTIDISFVNYEVLLIKLDADGNYMWDKKIGFTGKWEGARSIIETPEHDFVLAGNSQTEFDIDSYVHALKIDKNGNLLWSKTLKTGIAIDIARDLVLTRDNAYLLVGTTAKQPNFTKDIVLIKLDKQGNTLWTQRHDLNKEEEAFAIIKTPSTGYLITGETGDPKVGALEKFAFLMNIDEDGNKSWVKYYGRKDLQTTANSIGIYNGEAYIVGNTQEEYGKEHLFLAKANLLGNPTEPETIIEQIVVAPNPASHKINIKINNQLTGSLTIQFRNMAGQIIFSDNQVKNKPEFQKGYDISLYPVGIYIITVTLNSNKWDYKIKVTH